MLVTPRVRTIPPRKAPLHDMTPHLWETSTGAVPDRSLPCLAPACLTRVARCSAPGESLLTGTGHNSGMLCASCGASMPEAARYCGSCGAPSSSDAVTLGVSQLAAEPATDVTS